MLWKPFEVEFGRFQTLLESQSRDVREEINLAAQQATVRERHLQLVERNLAGQYRKGGEVHREEEKSSRLQYEERKLSKWPSSEA